jgi:mannose-6-phosphate isomerase-like protein (cupin superfamily)
MTHAPDPIDLASAFDGIREHFRPRIAAELNGQHVKLVKFAAPFVWHAHAAEDEMFLVWRGRFRMEFRDRVVELGPGQLLVVPRGVEHRPVAESEVEVVLFEPAGTLNTGDAPASDLTVREPGRL